MLVHFLAKPNLTPAGVACPRLQKEKLVQPREPQHRRSEARFILPDEFGWEHHLKPREEKPLPGFHADFVGSALDPTPWRAEVARGGAGGADGAVSAPQLGRSA